MYRAKERTKVRLFADDCIKYRTIKTTQDTDILQRELDPLQKWESNCSMFFPPRKMSHTKLNKYHLSYSRQTSYTD